MNKKERQETLAKIASGEIVIASNYQKDDMLFFINEMDIYLNYKKKEWKNIARFIMNHPSHFGVGILEQIFIQETNYRSEEDRKEVITYFSELFKENELWDNYFLETYPVKVPDYYEYPELRYIYKTILIRKNKTNPVLAQKLFKKYSHDYDDDSGISDRKALTDALIIGNFSPLFADDWWKENIVGWMFLIKDALHDQALKNHMPFYQIQLIRFFTTLENWAEYHKLDKEEQGFLLNQINLLKKGIDKFQTAD